VWPEAAAGLAELGIKAEYDALREYLGPPTCYPGTEWKRTLVDEVKARLSAAPIAPAAQEAEAILFEAIDAWPTTIDGHRKVILQAHAALARAESYRKQENR